MFGLFEGISTYLFSISFFIKYLYWLAFSTLGSKLKEFNALLTRSSARRNEFQGRAVQMGYEGPAPIAGWGVRWNIDLKMFSTLVSARDVSYSYTYFISFISLFFLILLLFLGCRLDLDCRSEDQVLPEHHDDHGGMGCRGGVVFGVRSNLIMIQPPTLIWFTNRFNNLIH